MRGEIGRGAARPAAGDVGPDVERLLREVGLHGFPYRELAAEERLRQAADELEAHGARLGGLGDAQGPVALVRPAALAGGPYTVAIASASRGAGRTLVAANLARAIASAGHRCLAVDLDPANGLAPRRTGDAARRGVLELALERDLAPPEPRSAGGVAWLPFGRGTREAVERAAAVDAAWLRERLDLVASGVEVAVLDTPCAPSPWLARAAELADEVWVVLHADRPAGAQIAAAQRALDALGVPATAVGWAVNRFDPRRASDRKLRAVLRATAGDRLRAVLHLDAAAHQQLGPPRLLAEAAPDSLLLADLERAAERLLERRARALARRTAPRRED